MSSASQAGLLKPRGAAGARADEKEVTAVYCRPFCETPLPAGDCRKKLSGDRPKDSPNLETITRAGAISARGNSLHGAILHCSTRRRAASSPEQALSASLSQKASISHPNCQDFAPRSTLAASNDSGAQRTARIRAQERVHQRHPPKIRTTPPPSARRGRSRPL